MCVCKFGCYGNSLCSLKIFVSIFELADRKNPTIHASIVSISCTELKSVQFWFIFGLIFVAMATPLAPLKIQVVYLNSPTLYTLPYMRKIPWFFAQNWNLCYFGLFSYKCGCHGNSLGSLEISDSIFEFADPDNLTIRVRNYWIFFAQNWNWCVFCFFFCPNLVAMATPMALLKFQLAYLNLTTPKTLLFVWKSPQFSRRTEIGAIFVYFCPNLVAIATPLAPL